MATPLVRSTPTRSAFETGKERELKIAPAAPEHRVQFYESEAFLAAAVAEFLAAGMAIGQSLVVIATEPHQAAFTAQLRADGLDVDGAIRSGQLALLDARETLDAFMNGDRPDAARFRTVVGGALEAARSRGGATPVLRLYGEMVDLLWRDGNTDGALELETLWNDLAGAFEFSLLCAYAMGNFYKADHTARFQQICRQHTHVLPTERYVVGESDVRLREISLLEQRARALEAEVEHRRELERRLRDTLDARRRAEDALRQREQELSALLAERERLLETERAARSEAEAARLEAETATRAKSQFLAVMSHELRTPLNAIAGHVQLLEMGIHGAVSHAQHEALERIERSQRHLLGLINEVLNLARVETGRIDYRLESVALQEVLAELLPMVEPLFAAKLIGHEVSLPAAPVHVRADREKLSQVLLNVLSNAAKFTGSGGRVTIDVASRAGIPDTVFVRITDTGIGIARDKQERIFAPFVQVHVGPTRPVDGAGLGLAISRELARGMGGDLRVRSIEGEGSTFTLSLGRAERPASGS